MSRAPDGVLLPVPGGSAFVIDSHGAGCWYRFRPGHPPDPMGSRFPTPEWEPMTPGKPWASGRVGVAEPIPAGLWMHAMPSVTEGPSREHARPVFAHAVQSTVQPAVQSPSSPPSSVLHRGPTVVPP